MKRLINYLFMIFIFIFVFNIYANAECSYQERKDLLDAAKNVDVSFEVIEKEEQYNAINPNTFVEETFTKTVYNFKMNVVGITDNIFLKITNNFNEEEIFVTSDKLIDNIYSYEIDNTTDIIKYYLSYYSQKDNCYASEIIIKTIKKPKENSLYYMPICSNEKVRNNEYCQQFIYNDFSLSETSIVEKLKSIIEEDNKNDMNNTFINVFKNIIFSYWYIFIIALVLIIIIIFLVNVRKKRSKL